MNWRLASRFSVVTLAVLVVIIVALVGLRSQQLASNATVVPTTAANQYGLSGTNLGGTVAPNFRLTDQFGKQVSLSQFKGEPVVLTFLYTHCPDECPTIANKLYVVMKNLGSEAQHVGILAVSTDPSGDTLSSVQHFSQVHHMLNYWHYLMGTQSQLSPVWNSYSIYSGPAPTQDVATSGPVDHTLALYVIDKQGHEQVYLGNDFSASQLTSDLKILLKQ
jgi:protein SCO1/2